MHLKKEAFIPNAMVNRGLITTECPSNQLKSKLHDNSDNDDIPYPDDDDEFESSDEANLRDKIETGMSETNGI